MAAKAAEKTVGSLTVTVYENSRPLTVEDAKKLIGWTEIPEDSDEPGLFRDLTKKKIKLNNNSTNRPLRLPLAKRYMSDICRNKWKLNGETMVFDDKKKCQSGQHRLVGFILAEQQRQLQEAFWKEHYGWDGPITIECVVVEGISHEDDTVNTIDQGQKRSSGDVIYRANIFGSVTDTKPRQKMSNMLAGTIRLVWLRVGGKKVSDAPHFPISESMDFLKAHPKLQECVEYIAIEDTSGGADGAKMSKYVSLPYAAGLMYLMGTSNTDRLEYAEKGGEAISFEMMPKAKEFWNLFSSGTGLDSTHPISVLKDLLMGMSASAGMARDLIIGMIIKAFNAWLDEREVSDKDIRIELVRNDKGKPVPFEHPRLGGLDVEVDDQDGPAERKVAAPELVDESEPEATTEFAPGDKVWVLTPKLANQWQGIVKDFYEEEGINKVLVFDPKKKEEKEVIAELCSHEKWTSETATAGK